MMPLIRDFPFDAIITTNRHTLVSANAEPMIELCAPAARRSSTPRPTPAAPSPRARPNYNRYVYQEATDEMLAPVRAVEAVCARHGVPAGAAALQFSLRDPRVAATICGVSKPERVAQTLEWANYPIPDAVWADLGRHSPRHRRPRSHPRLHPVDDDTKRI